MTLNMARVVSSRTIFEKKMSSTKKAKKARGRPRVKNPATAYLNVRVTPSEKAKYFQAATKAGQGLSAWLKSLADRFS